MGIGAKIGEVARKKKISLKELSRRVDLPYTTVYHMVSRDSKVDFETACKIAYALEVDPNWLMYGYTLDNKDEAFLRKLMHEPISPRDLYLETHPDDEPAPIKRKGALLDADRLTEGLNEENLQKLYEYAKLLKLGQDAQTVPSVPADKDPEKK